LHGAPCKSLEHDPARQKRKKNRRPRPPDPCAFTVSEFCDRHRVSRSWLYEEWRAGRGPKFKNIGVKRIITNEAAAEWRNADQSEPGT
jgi:hypothetical protein